jgi:hypothetical protein
MKTNNPFRTVWNILSIPFGVLGILGLSDSLVDFQSNIQNIINSYRSIVYPPFHFLFGWLWFTVPEVVFDYLFFGILFTSNQLKVWGFRKIHEKLLENIKFYIRWLILSILFWPIIAGEMTWQIFRTRPDGLIKSLAERNKPFYVRYNMRDADIMVFRYIGAVLLIFVIVLIVNYTYRLKP